MMRLIVLSMLHVSTNTMHQDTDINGGEVVPANTKDESLMKTQPPNEQDSVFVIDWIGDDIVDKEQEPQSQQRLAGPESEPDTQPIQATTEEANNESHSKSLLRGNGSRMAPLNVDAMANGSAAALLGIDESGNDDDSADKLESGGSRVAFINDDTSGSEEQEEPFASLEDSDTNDFQVMACIDRHNNRSSRTTRRDSKAGTKVLQDNCVRVHSFMRWRGTMELIQVNMRRRRL